MNDFHTDMGQEASDKFGVGELNGAFKVGAEWARKELLKESKKLKNAIDHINSFCLCERNTYGFDYSEKHPHMGKPKGGARWKTPRDYIKDNGITHS